jgi:hypothetical protein
MARRSPADRGANPAEKFGISAGAIRRSADVFTVAEVKPRDWLKSSLAEENAALPDSLLWRKTSSGFAEYLAPDAGIIFCPANVVNSTGLVSGVNDRSLMYL